MVQQSLNVAYSDSSSQVLWEDGELVFGRGWRQDDSGHRIAVLLIPLPPTTVPLKPRSPHA